MTPSERDPALDGDADTISLDELDQHLARDVGPYLRIYLCVARHEPAVDRLNADLAELYALLLRAQAFVHAGERASLQGRLYALVDEALPHLGRPALRAPLDPELTARARVFVSALRDHWHAGYAEVVTRLLALDEEDRRLILWRDFHALSMAEIGGRLGLEREAARSRVERARDRARQSALEPPPAQQGEAGGGSSSAATLP